MTKSWAAMALANRRPRGCDGQFVSRPFAREAQRMGEQVREVLDRITEDRHDKKAVSDQPEDAA